MWGFDRGYNSLTKEEVEDARRGLNDPKASEGMSPLQRQFYKYALDPSRYQGYEDNPESQASRTPFAKRYDKYYSPFMQGWSGAEAKNIPTAAYKEEKYYDPSDERARKRRYNKTMANMSQYDDIVNKASSGAASMMGMAGGLPGMVGGLVLAKGAPLLYNALKRYRAKKDADDNSSYYRKQTRKNFQNIE